MRRIRSLACLLVCLLLGGAFARAEDSRKLNVLFIMSDDLNEWVSCCGVSPDSKTPNIDRLAQRGTLFTHAYCAAPACNPSRVALLTGRRPSTTGVYHNSQPWRPVLPDVVTLPQHFMARGYRVAGCGKIFHDAFRDPASWHEYGKKKKRPIAGPAPNRGPQNHAGSLKWGALDVPDEDMDDFGTVSWGIDFLNRKHDQPFFLGVGLHKPHLPWHVPQKYFDMYPLESIRVPETMENDLGDVPPAGREMARPEGDHRNIIQSGNWLRAVQAYLACIAFADAQIGRLLDAVDQSEHAQDTLIVLMGDHGWHLGEKEHWRKFALWEEATRTPLIFIVPGVTKPGSVCRRSVDFVHIYPTICELCGLPPGEGLEGQSFASLLKDPAAEWSVPAIMTHGRNNHAIRSDRYRYIRYEDGSEELYDHEADPLEWHNLAVDSAATAAKAELANWLPKTNAENAPKAGEARGQQD